MDRAGPARNADLNATSLRLHARDSSRQVLIAARTKLLRWSGRSSRNVPCIFDRSLLSVEPHQDMASLAANERRALYYFETRLWPQFSTVDLPCSQVMSAALRSTPVRHATCAFAEEHGAPHERGLPRDSLMNSVLHCITAIREQPADLSGRRGALSHLLLAGPLRCFLDEFVACTQQHLTLQFHYKGALATIEALGGQQFVCPSSNTVISLLLFEFVAADLTEAVLQGRQPYFHIDIWKQIESGPVRWAVQDAGSQSLPSVFGTMASIKGTWAARHMIDVMISSACFAPSPTEARRGPAFSAPRPGFPGPAPAHLG